MNVISCKRLTKRFGPTVAVSELDLEVSAGRRVLELPGSVSELGRSRCLMRRWVADGL